VLIALLAVVSSSGVVAVPAATAASNPVITDCVDHGRLTQSYTAAQLKFALSTMSAETKQYTDCVDVINNALPVAIARGKNGGGGGGSGGSFLPTPVIVIIVVLALAGATFGALAVRRRRQEGADWAEGSEPPPDAGDRSEPPPDAGDRSEPPPDAGDRSEPPGPPA
jgi:hypothetical protein